MALRPGRDAPPFDLLMALREIEGLRVNPEPLDLSLSTGSRP